jgi:GNAT superfamily N-acetyltransferase
VAAPIVRPAVVADAWGIATVHVRAWQQTYAHLLPADRLAALVPEDRNDGWRRILEADDEDAWVAEFDGRIVGWITTSSRDPARHPRARELNGLYTLADVHGSGIGQQLLDAGIGAEPAFLWSAADNPRAAAFYRRNGFVLDGATDEYAMLGTTVTIVRWVR